MDHRPLIAAVLLLCSGFSFAGYAELAPPERFSGSPGDWKFAPSANDTRYGKIALQKDALRVPVPGVNATMPAAYRFAANAPRFAAAAVFLSPHLRLAVGIAGWLGIAKVIWDESGEIWREVKPPSPDLMWHNGAGALDGGPFSTYQQAAEALRASYSRYGSYTSGTYCTQINPKSYSCSFGNSNIGSKPIWATETANIICPPGWTFSPAGCLSPAVKQPEFVEKLAPTPMPETVPWELPYPTPLPVDDPFINPNPSPNPQHKPKFVPTGEPVKNPNYDPNAAPGPANEPWIQPGIRVTPKPTPSEPWRVQIDPVNVPQSGPEPLPDTPNEPGPNDQAKPEEQQSLCEKHPDIVACQKLGTLKPEVLQKKTVPLTITKEEGFGPSTGACPAPKTFAIMGKPMAFRWDLLCDFASQIRPLLIGFAYLSAALAFMGLSRKD